MHRHPCKATGIIKSQGNNSTKEYSKPPVTGPKEMESQELPNEVFNIIVLQMPRELQENINKQFNIRKTIPE